MKHETGICLQNGDSVKLGDKLKGAYDEVVVLWDEENQEYGVEVIGFPEVWFELKHYILAWSNLTIVGNINKRSDKNDSTSQKQK